MNAECCQFHPLTPCLTSSGADSQAELHIWFPLLHATLHGGRLQSGCRHQVRLEVEYKFCFLKILNLLVRWVLNQVLSDVAPPFRCCSNHVSPKLEMELVIAVPLYGCLWSSFFFWTSIVSATLRFSFQQIQGHFTIFSIINELDLSIIKIQVIIDIRVWPYLLSPAGWLTYFWIAFLPVVVSDEFHCDYFIPYMFGNLVLVVYTWQLCHFCRLIKDFNKKWNNESDKQKMMMWLFS